MFTKMVLDAAYQRYNSITFRTYTWQKKL